MSRISFEGALFGVEIAFTGRLASMSRSEAMERARGAGGLPVASPGASTALLVAGDALGQLGRDGRVARNLVRFRELSEGGAPIKLIGEIEFLRMLGAQDELPDLSRLYTAAQVSRIAEAPQSEVRSWIRHGFLRPARLTYRLAWFEFRDILLAKNLSRLTSSGVSATALRRSLARIATWLPDAQWVLGRLDAAAEGLRLRLSDGGWADPSGQRLLEFGQRDDSAYHDVAIRAFSGDGREAGSWFARAIEAEERGDLRAAVANYRRAIEEAPDAVAEFNLGNALYELGQDAEAAERYLAALELEPDYIEAWNNLGNALAALGKLEDALRSYEKALSLEADYVEVHCNLAVVLSRLGRAEEAARHRSECAKAYPSERSLRLVRGPFEEEGET